MHRNSDIRKKILGLIIPEALQKGFNGINSLGFHRVTKLLQMVEQKEAIGAVPVKGVFRNPFDHLLSFFSLVSLSISLVFYLSPSPLLGFPPLWQKMYALQGTPSFQLSPISQVLIFCGWCALWGDLSCLGSQLPSASSPPIYSRQAHMKNLKILC